MIRFLQISDGDKAYQMGYDLGSFVNDNLFLILGLIIGIIVAIVMRKNLNAKP
tara:strand:- start:95 stop:253 length:159 start_codon:yes stop_codon:yes gene_type:complete